jgi:recombination protein RecT
MSNELATINDRTVLSIPKIKGMFAAALPQIQQALPDRMKKVADRMARVMVTEISKNPKLAECTALSLFGTCLQAAQLGLEIGGVLGQAYPVPYRNNKLGIHECQFQIGYRGLINLAHRSEQVSNVSVRSVKAKDKFDYELGTSPKIYHKASDEPDRGDITHVYTIIFFRDGGFDFEVMTAEEVESHRKRYSKQRGDYTPWETAWEEMAKKTPCRRLMKRAPVSVECLKAAVLSEYDDEGVPQQLSTLVDRQQLAAAEATPAARGRTEELAERLSPTMKSGDGIDIPG